MPRSAACLAAGGLLVVAVLAGCGAHSDGSPSGASTRQATTAVPSAPATTTPATPTATATPTERRPPGTVPPPWLGERVLPLSAEGYGETRPTPPRLRHRRFTLPDTVDPLPGTGFGARAVSPAPDRVIARSTWHPGCPVDRDRLTWLRVTFRGFDGERHTGELLVHAEVAADLRRVFADLWRAGFPIEEMRVVRAEELDAPPTGDGNNTTAFVCRAVTGGSSFSQHAYGLAIDVNPFQNPYLEGDRVLPELAGSYLDRDDVRPGMITDGGPVVAAFAAVGWEWGGHWQSLKDYQHFSRNGR